MEMILIFVMFVFSVVVVAQPLLRPRSNYAITIQAELKALNSQKIAIYHLIKQVDMEHELGFLNEEDYLASRNRLKLEASQLIAIIKEKKANF